VTIFRPKTLQAGKQHGHSYRQTRAGREWLPASAPPARTRHAPARDQPTRRSPYSAGLAVRRSDPAAPGRTGPRTPGRPHRGLAARGHRTGRVIRPCPVRRERSLRPPRIAISPCAAYHGVISVRQDFP
jgi:hypothetical protein